MKKYSNLIPAIFLILALIYRNITFLTSTDDLFLLIGVLVVVLRMIFFKVSLKQSIIYVILLGFVGVFFTYIYAYDNVNDLILTNYLILGSMFSFLNMVLMSYLIYRKTNYEKIVGIIYLINAIIVSIEVIPQVANIIEILAVIVYIVVLCIKVEKDIKIDDNLKLEKSINEVKDIKVEKK
ncbi:MAG: hypothetical protein KGV54_00430 [Oceanivirga sp.]|nr:hypothetical protein [Oceanivirga sp.]